MRFSIEIDGQTFRMKQSCNQGKQLETMWWFTSLKLLLLVVLIVQLITGSTRAQSSPCNREFSFLAAAKAKDITQCKKLNTFAAEFGWKYYKSNSSNNYTSIDILFSVLMPRLPHGWLAWGLNPGSKPQMIGTRALIAFNNGTNVLAVYHYNITGQAKNKCKLTPSDIELTVKNVEANYTTWNHRAVIFASLSLPQEYNISKLHMVWQIGALVVNNVPRMHARRLENFDSIETIDLHTGHCVDYRRLRLRYVHGILSALGWGTFLPIGAILARYFRESPFATLRWFRLHVSCQILAFFLGTIAWSCGIVLMNTTHHFKSFLAHKVVGIFVFVLAALQMMALWLKPTRSDKYRRYWNIYHHMLGFTIIVLAIINIFKGLSMLEPSSTWRWIYVGIITVISAVALGFEITIWAKFGIDKYVSKQNKQIFQIKG